MAGREVSPGRTTGGVREEEVRGLRECESMSERVSKEER